MKRPAFSLLELIFVLVIMGVLAGVGFYLTRPDATRADAQFALLKLKEARYRALGYDALTPQGCVELSVTSLESGPSPKHDITSSLLPISAMSSQTLCFDAMGRPHDGNSTELSTLIRSPLELTFVKGDQNTTITLYPQTGYAIITCSN